MAFWTMSTFSARVGAIFTAASVMIRASSCPGTSITKQWLTRRAVRRPVSRRTTAPISSSVCKLPFIRASALPSRTSSTALAAEAWLKGASTMVRPPMSMSNSRATASIRSRGPTRMGWMSPILAALTAPSRELWSQGWATAVGVGGRVLQKSIKRWYFSCLAGMGSLRSKVQSGLLDCRDTPAGARFGGQHLPHSLHHGALLGRGLALLHSPVLDQTIQQRQQAGEGYVLLSVPTPHASVGKVRVLVAHERNE